MFSGSIRQWIMVSMVTIAVVICGCTQSQQPDDPVDPADDATGILIGNDQGNGLFNAYLPQEDGSIEILWQNEVRNSAHTSIVSDREMVYTSDYVDGSNHLVVFDLKTGEELLRVPTPSTRATFSVVAHTSSNETFLVAPESGKPTGFVVRFYVKEAQ